MGYKLEINASNKHIHLDQDDLDKLFGKGYELTSFKTASRPWALATVQPRLCLGTVAEGTDLAWSWRTYLILQGLPAAG